jgi:hypothetical protein
MHTYTLVMSHSQNITMSEKRMISTKDRENELLLSPLFTLYQLNRNFPLSPSISSPFS